MAQLFFDPERAKFPLSIDYEWNLVRRIANWVPFLLLSPAAFSLLRKLVFPDQKMLIAIWLPDARRISCSTRRHCARGCQGASNAGRTAWLKTGQ